MYCGKRQAESGNLDSPALRGMRTDGNGRHASLEAVTNLAGRFCSLTTTVADRSEADSNLERPAQVRTHCSAVCLHPWGKYVRWTLHTGIDACGGGSSRKRHGSSRAAVRQRSVCSVVAFTAVPTVPQGTTPNDQRLIRTAVYELVCGQRDSAPRTALRAYWRAGRAI